VSHVAGARVDRGDADSGPAIRTVTPIIPRTLRDAEEVGRGPAVRRRDVLAVVVGGILIRDGRPGFKRASSVQSYEPALEYAGLATLRLSRGFKRGGLRLANDPNLVSRLPLNA
jgi:hypothetical protein